MFILYLNGGVIGVGLCLKHTLILPVASGNDLIKRLADATESMAAPLPSNMRIVKHRTLKAVGSSTSLSDL